MTDSPSHKTSVQAGIWAIQFISQETMQIPTSPLVITCEIDLVVFCDIVDDWRNRDRITVYQSLSFYWFIYLSLIGYIFGNLGRGIYLGSFEGIIYGTFCWSLEEVKVGIKFLIFTPSFCLSLMFSFCK